LPPIEGRAVLSGLQSSVKVDISGIIVTEKTIIVDGQNIVLTSSNLKMQKAYCRFYVFSWGWVLGDFQPISEWLEI
jgi:hypothetical protein